jgi:5-methylcytosine-specific restriction endonuclease McrA
MTLGATGPCTTPRLTRRTGWPTDLVERVRDEIATSAYAHILVGQRKRRRLPRELTRRVFDRDGYRCVFCASARRLQVDHIHPVVHGGSDDFDNLQTLCAPCNRRKGASLA